MSVKLIVLSDIRLYREGVALNVSSHEPALDVVACADTSEAMRLVDSSRKAIFLIDAGIADSLDEVRWIRNHSRDARILALAVPPESDDEALVAAQAGISGYISPEAGVDELLSKILGAGESDSRQVPHRAVPTAAPPAARPAPVDTLTAREQEVLALLNIGLSNKQIARQLSIRLATVKNHVHSILAKLNVKRRGEAVAATAGRIRSV